MQRCERCGEELPAAAWQCPKCGRCFEAILLELLQDAEPAVRAQAVSNLGFCHASERVIRAFAAALSDAESTVRREAGLQLFLRGRLAEAAIPALIAALDDPDIVVRRFAAAALSMIGPPAQSALQKLSELRDTADDKLRVWVLEAERNISGS